MAQSSLVHPILLVFAFVLMVVAAWRCTAPEWNRLVAIAWACMILSLLI